MSATATSHTLRKCSSIDSSSRYKRVIFLLPTLLACGSGVTDQGAEVYDALAFSDQELPEAWVGINYRHMLTAEGGVPPVTWSIDRGRLPDGLRLKYDGRITGTPTATQRASRASAWLAMLPE